MNYPAITGSQSAVSVAVSGLTTIATIETLGYSRLCFHFDVVTADLDDFDVLGEAHLSATAVDFTPTSWTSLPAGGRILESSGNLAAITATSNGYFAMDVNGLARVVVQASATGAASSVTSYWSLMP